MNNKKTYILSLSFLFFFCIGTFAQTWYDEAEQRIDTLRKGDFSFKVIDAVSNPIQDSIFIKLKKHEFQWGNLLTQPDYDQNDFDWYQATLLKYFNAANVERYKWNYMEPVPGTVDYSEIDTIIYWAEKADWYVRGHCSIWGGAEPWQLPSWIVADTMSGENMYAACETRIRRDVTKYAGAIHEYDVINEPFHETWLADRTGDSINWNGIKWAKESDPAAKMFVNEYNIIVWSAVDEYVNKIQELLDNGAPLDGIGVQGHMENNINWQEIKTSLDKLSQFNLPITVTEFDMKIDEYGVSEQAQANYYGQIMRTMFSYPLVDGFYFFGVYDKYAWREGSGIFNENKIPKIAADTVYHLIHEKWSTTIDDTTGTDGVYQFEGFYGDYEITVKSGDSIVIFNVPFTRVNEGTEIELNLTNSLKPHPELLSIQTNKDGSIIELEFDMEMNDPSSNSEKFSIYSTAKIPFTDISLKNGNPRCISLTLATPLIYRQKAVVNYTFGDLTSSNGGTLSNFGPEVINNRLPGFREAYTNESGTLVSVTFSQEMNDTIPEAFTIIINNNEHGISVAELDASDSKTILFTLEAPIIISSDLITITYNPGNYKSADDYLLGAFGPKFVQNNVPPVVSSINKVFIGDIKVYPNPADKKLFVEFKNTLVTNASYEILDIYGRVTSKGILNSHQELDISQLDNGMYFIRVKIDENFIIKKFLVE